MALLRIMYGSEYANLTTYGIFIDELKPYFYTNLSLSARLPGKVCTDVAGAIRNIKE